MKFTCDSTYAIGQSHKTCQDYTRHGFYKNLPYIIVCDGCSSAKDSDVGARILALSAEKNIDKIYSSTDKFLNFTLAAAKSHCDSLGLNEEALSATLMVAYIDYSLENPFCRTVIVGDGTVVFSDLEGTLYLKEYSFNSGAPYYLRYELSGDVKQNYIREFGNKVTYRTLTRNANKSYEGEERPTELCKNGYFIDICFLNKYDTVTLMSDGISSFLETQTSETAIQKASVPIERVVPGFVAFKGVQGAFVHRRVNKELKRLEKEQCQNADDLSVATIAWREDK